MLIDPERGIIQACACLSILAALLVISGTGLAAIGEMGDICCHLYINTTSDGQPIKSKSISVEANGLPAKYLGGGQYYVSVPLQPDVTIVNANATYNGYTVTGTGEAGEDGTGKLTLDFPGDAVRHTVTGTIYFIDNGERYPWHDDRITLYVNGMAALLDGPNYSINLSALSSGDIVTVKVVQDCGYVLGEKSVLLDAGERETCVDVEVQSLVISGDVYMDGYPADGSTLFIYINDRPTGPITATSVYDHNGTQHNPMFSTSIPGAHPGDHIVITASRGGHVGIVTQDALDYDIFLTINLKDIRMYVPYA